MQRFRRIAPALVGLGLAGLILWRGGAALEASAESQEHFAVHVEQPGRIVALPSEEQAGSMSPEQLTWRARIGPASERERVELHVDGVALEARDGGSGEGTIELPLLGIAAEPGWHFIEVELERRGGRLERVVDPVLVGRFAGATIADPGPDPDSNTDPDASPSPEPATKPGTEPARPCAATFTASPALIEGLLVPMLEREVLPALRQNEHMGPDTAVSEAKLELRDDVVRFELELSGVNTLGVSGVVSVAIVDERELYAKLITLGEVDFRGELRDQARGLGLGGGALIGGLITGPLAPVGAAAGWYLADKYVSKKARELVREQIDEGLAQLSGIELLPEEIELIPGRPRSRVALGFCDQTGVRATGLVAGLWLEPAPQLQPGAPRFDLGVPGPMVTGAKPTSEPLSVGEDIRVELSVDLVNALLTEWTASGLLAALLGEQRAFEKANVELATWTPLRLERLTPTRPPTLAPAGGPAAGFRYGLGGLAVELGGLEDQPWGRVFVAAAGTVSPSWDPETGELGLVGSLDRLELTCAQGLGPGEPGAEPGAEVALQGCFSEVLEAAEVRQRIDAHLRPNAAKLPKLALNELLVRELGVSVASLELGRPRPGILRLGAGLDAGE